MSASFHITIENSTLSVRLDRPEKHNMLDPALMFELRDALLAAAKDTSIRVMTLTGTGKSFCAGADLGKIGKYNFDENPFEQLTWEIENLPFPTICALNGGVYGGGTDLALSCDFRIGVTGMKTFIPPARLGIHYPPVGLNRAVARLGLGPAKRLFLACETLQAEEMKEIGFLDYLVAPEDLKEKTASLASNLTALAPLSVSGMKATLNEIARGEFDMARARERQARCLASDDFVEGKAAMTEKRPPAFTGK
ncbi:MAG: enoyl-CoA hydratase/isomerase family protein [Alphaproteobacteria bacterium]|nr:MAG: enoyl-CoA hydratase/isomerase family protein [Alphaproteobacteria bacterium]